MRRNGWVCWRAIVVVAPVLVLLSDPWGLLGRAAAQETAPSCCGKSFVVVGVGGHQRLPTGVTVANAVGDPAVAAETFAEGVWGPDLVATVPDLQPGTYTVLIDCVETHFHEPGKRVMDITCQGRTLAHDLDLFQSAGGFARAYRLTATVAYAGRGGDGEPFTIRFHAKTDVAEFNSIHIRDSLGNGVACVTARDLHLVEVPGANVIPNVPGPVKYKDPSLPAAVRAADLVSRMTLAEKAAQMQNAAPAIPRLEVPEYDYWNECLHGDARSGYSTVFPEPIGMAASFDPPLVGQVADTIAIEARAKYNDAVLHNDRSRYHGLTFWTPNINIFRDPRWGRGQETYGEDPFLTGRFAVEFIQHLQGDDPHYLKLVATAKHFAVHSGPENLRHQFDAQPPARDLYETYLPQFEAAVRQGHVASVMGAYNATDGVPCCASDFLLGRVLRKTWGFDGYVVSDCGAIEDIWLQHHYAPFKSVASALAVKAGCDLECGFDYASLVQATNANLIDADEMDTALTRLFTARFRLGMFDPPGMVPWDKLTIDQNCTPAAAALAKKVADESLVLLKNDHATLPLNPGKLHTIALVGPNLDTWTAFYGNYNGLATSAPTLLESLRAKLGDAVRIIPVRGCPYAPTPGELEIVPDVCLQHRGAGGAIEPGLAAEYFTNPDLAGAPSITRSDLAIDIWYRDTPHVMPYPNRSTSARWTGQFVAPADGDFALAVGCTEPFRLWLDGKLAIDDWKQQDRPPARANLILHKGQAVDLKLEYSHAFSDRSRIALYWNRKDIDVTPLILDRIKDADTIIFASGINGDIEGEEGESRRPLIGFNGDRDAIELPAMQDQLIQALAGTGKPMVLVNFSGSAMAMPWEAEHLPAILQAWYPGQAGGSAVVDALLGETNPAGRLPVTFYRATSDLPAFTDYAMSNRTYRYFTGSPLWAFGHGLSYSAFSYANPTVEHATVTAAGTIRVGVDVTNTGPRDGEEVVQLYAEPATAMEGNPLRSLRAFQRVGIAAGATARVVLNFPATELRRWDVATSAYVVYSGEYRLRIGPASDQLPLVVTVTVRGSSGPLSR